MNDLLRRIHDAHERMHDAYELDFSKWEARMVKELVEAARAQQPCTCGQCDRCYRRANAEVRQSYQVVVPCRCGITNVWPIGTVDPEAYECSHVMRWDPRADRLICSACGIFVRGQTLAANGFGRRDRYDNNGNDLADEAQRLRDENRDLHAMVSRLERRLERVERKP